MNSNNCEFSDTADDVRLTSTASEMAVSDCDAHCELDYEPVPAQSVTRVRARFRYVGDGRPLPYCFDDEN